MLLTCSVSETKPWTGAILFFIVLLTKITKKTNNNTLITLAAKVLQGSMHSHHGGNVEHKDVHICQERER